MNDKLKRYKQLVENRYLIYNALFLNLPYDKLERLGILIPVLAEECERGYNEGLEPKAIIDGFFEKSGIDSEEDKISFFFRVIQYVERQVVLFDAIEDARFRDRDPAELRPLVSFFRELDGSDEALVSKKLERFGVRIVFTAHPTQFYPLRVLDIISDLRECIFNNDIEAVNDLLVQLGMTSFLYQQKPSPLDEALNIIYYLRNVYYRAVGDLLYGVVQSRPGFTNFDLLKLGFWPCGDRDGNPFVTAQTTMKVADELRMTIYKCYYHDVKRLKRRLSFRGISEILESMRIRLYDAMFDSSKLIPWTDLKDQLNQVKALLVRDYNSFYIEEVEQLLVRVHAFKSYFASLDIRQDHSVHEGLVKRIYELSADSERVFDELTDKERLAWLEQAEMELNSAQFEDPLYKDTIDNIKQLRTIQARNGESSCHRYIISNAEDIFSVLYVYHLFRWCGVRDSQLTFDIVPLFETMAGMSGAEQTMKQLFELDSYHKHLERRGMKQTIMLGFSDGTKDGGYMKANWSIYQTKSVLSSLCKQYGVEVVFFDGRGGPPARGGGKSHRFYASAGKDIANNEIQLTIQGQTITSTYGTAHQFVYNCEQLICAGLRKEINKRADTVSKSEQELFEKLSTISYGKYDALKQHPEFIPYLEEMSTLRFYSNANIGSRPSKRGKSARLTLADLRAISFVGSWSQLKQNVPGYFGFGTALKQLMDEGYSDRLKKLFESNAYFRALVLNSMMSLKKCYFPLTSYMKRNQRFSDFWQLLFDEYKLSMECLLEVTGYDALMAEEDISRRSIEMREKIVLPLLSIQQYALQALAADSAYSEKYKKIVTRSMYGNINASRNSA